MYPETDALRNQYTSMLAAGNVDFTLPAFPNGEFLLERPRVYGLLAKALEGGTLIISAGEGAGKTVAINSFLRRRKETTIWIQISERDNHPWRFWENYTRALGQCKAQAGKELREIGFPETSQQLGKWYEITRREFSYPGKYVIVGDDFHRIKSRNVLDFLDRVFTYRIPNHTLVLICRNDPALNIVPLISKGHLARIGAEELLFTKDEIAEYFRLWNIELSMEEIAAIHHDTEGLPLALNIVAAEIQRNRKSYSRPALQKSAFKIFEDEMFESVPKELQCYLVKLALLEQWPLDLLEESVVILPEQYRHLPSLLLELEKLSSLVRYDYYLQGYRIHQLFLEYLREKQKELPKEEIKEFSAIAAAWCLKNNLMMDTAINFERAGNYAGLAGIIDTFPRIIPFSAASPLLDIIGRLMARDDRDDADEHFIYLRHVARGRLLMCLGRFDQAVAVFEENTRRFEPLPPVPVNLKILAESWNFLGIIGLLRWRYDNNDSNIACFEQADYYYKQNPYPLKTNMTICNVSSYVNQIAFPAEAGEFEHRLNIFAACLSRAANALNGYFAGMDDLARTELAYFQGELNTAEECARRTIIRAREKNQYEIELRALFYLLRINLHRGNIEELMELWEQKDSILNNEDYPNRSTMGDIINGWLFIQLGDQKKSAPWLRNKLEASDMYSMFLNFESLVKAKYLFAEKQFAETVSFLNQKENKEGLGSFLLGMIEMNCLEAAAYCHLRDEAAAIASLEKAYQEAAPNLLTIPFIELGNDMRSLAAIALNAGNRIPRLWLEEMRKLASAYSKNIFALSEQFKRVQPHNSQPPSQAVYLTRQERAVLNGLSRGQTREEIAAVAGQPLSAVKSLISRICGKLGAINRADAIRIASNLGILEE